jgi:regulator of replication initiation timing
MQELFYVEPLLLAYDDKLARLEQLLADLQEDMRGFEGKIAQVVSENNFLRT